MRIIRAPTLARAHELAVKTVLEKGWVLETENEEATVECDELALVVESPESESMVSSASRFQKRFLDVYAENLLRGSDAKFEYDYHRRLFDWGERLTTAGEDVHIDQVDYIAQKLIEAPATRRAVAVTWNPVIDEDLDDCPCLQARPVPAPGREGRDEGGLPSNDILSAAGSNIRSSTSRRRSRESRCSNRALHPHRARPHIYYLRDLDDIEPFCRSGTAIQPIAEVCRACGSARGHPGCDPGRHLN